MRLILLWLPLLAYANCIEIRGALDVGSGATKLKVSRFNHCKNIIIETVFQKNFSVQYKNDLIQQKSKKFSDTIMQQGLAVFKKSRAIFDKLKVKRVRAVATSAFRTAANTKEYVEKVRKESGIELQIISQKEEAILGYKSAKSLSRNKNYIVWDIGGGSMQMSFIENGVASFYQGKLASVPFRDYMIKVIQKSTKKTPNPISLAQCLAGQSYVKEYALNDVPEKLRKLFKRKDIDILGIGEVHSFAILKAMGSQGSYTKKALETFMHSRISLSDSDIGGEYASTSITNLILAYSYMDALGIDTVIAGSVNLADGLMYND